MSEKNDEKETEEREEETEEAEETKEIKEAEVEEEVVEERIYTVPLGRARIAPVTKRAPRAIRILRAFIKRHMKADDEDSIVISNEVNEKIWSRGIEKPPRRIRVRVTKDREGLVRVYLAEGE
ncbi:MAG TPA: 50S ribosomal protein L31e [Candidatus Bathyarchaeota archaeon]|nr:50S ribosomal protein L31e [Candidatus Bathyarchaeota archaeon]